MFDIILSSFAYVKGGSLNQQASRGQERAFLGQAKEGKSPKGGWNNPLETKIGRGPCANCDSTR